MKNLLLLSALIGSLASAQEAEVEMFKAPVSNQTKDTLFVITPSKKTVVTPVENPAKLGVPERKESEFKKVTSTPYQDYLGFAGGMVAGTGLSYKHWFESGWGFQLTGYPYYSESHYPQDRSEWFHDSENRISGTLTEASGGTGLLLMKSLNRYNAINIFTYLGGSWAIDYKDADYIETYYYNSQVAVKERKNEQTVSAGVGFGAEVFLWRFAAHLMVGYGGTENIENKSKALSPTIDGAIYFRY